MRSVLQNRVFVRGCQAELLLLGEMQGERVVGRQTVLGPKPVHRRHSRYGCRTTMATTTTQSMTWTTRTT